MQSELPQGLLINKDDTNLKNFLEQARRLAMDFNSKETQFGLRIDQRYDGDFLDFGLLDEIHEKLIAWGIPADGYFSVTVNTKDGQYGPSCLWHSHSPHGVFMATDIGAECAIHYPNKVLDGSLNHFPFWTLTRGEESSGQPETQEEIVEQFAREQSISVGSTVYLESYTFYKDDQVGLHRSPLPEKIKKGRCFLEYSY